MHLLIHSKFTTNAGHIRGSKSNTSGYSGYYGDVSPRLFTFRYFRVIAVCKLKSDTFLGTEMFKIWCFCISFWIQSIGAANWAIPLIYFPTICLCSLLNNSPIFTIICWFCHVFVSHKQNAGIFRVLLKWADNFGPFMNFAMTLNTLWAARCVCSNYDCILNFQPK